MQVQAGLPPGDRPRRPRYEELALIFITARFRVLPDRADDWPEISRAFTEATRAEEGCLWFDWSRSLDDPAEYVLVEAFRDGDAGAAHVRSAHFAEAQRTLPQHLAETPRIVNADVPGTDWSELGELRVER
jgi:quinol monooxygenase YgiN